MVAKIALLLLAGVAAEEKSPEVFQKIHDSFNGHLANENLHGISNVQLGSNETASGIAELESSAKKAIDSDIKYYEGLMRLTKGSKSQLPVDKIKTLVQETLEHRENLQKDGLTSLSKLVDGSKKAALGLFEISDSKSQKSQQLKAEQKVADYFAGFTQCVMKMPIIWRISYEAASFCRVYAYTCNNLWPENLHSEIAEGIYCIVSTYEQTTDPEEVHATQLMYRNLLTQFIIPTFDFLMVYYQFQKPAWYPEKTKLYSCENTVSDKKKVEVCCTKHEVDPERGGGISTDAIDTHFTAISAALEESRRHCSRFGAVETI
jgi:hypothetical protein